MLWSVCLLASTTISHGQPLSAFASQDSGSLLAGKNQIGDSAKSIIENVSFSSSAAVGARPSLSPKAAASVEPKQITSTLNGFGSSKQVAKVMIWSCIDEERVVFFRILSDDQSI